MTIDQDTPSAAPAAAPKRTALAAPTVVADLTGATDQLEAEIARPEAWMDVLWGRPLAEESPTADNEVGRKGATGADGAADHVVLLDDTTPSSTLVVTPQTASSATATNVGPGVDGVTLLVVEENGEVAQRILDLLGGFSCATFRRFDDIRDVDWWGSTAVMAILGPSQAEQPILQRIGNQIRGVTGRGAVLLMDDSSAVTLRVALRAGLSDALLLDQMDGDLYDSVYDIASRLAEDAKAPTGGGVTAPTSDRPRGRVTSVFSPKGGVGKTTVSVNLASLLARQNHQPVVVVDLDLQFGDVAVMLRVDPTHHVADAALAGDLLDHELLRSLLVHHEGSGARVLAAPSDPTMADHVTPATVSRLLRLLRETGAHVIIDCAPHLDGVILQALSESDDIVYVAGMDVPTLKNARIGLQALDVVQIPKERVLLLLNRADSGVNLEPKDVERTLQRKVDVSVPSDAVVPRSVNRGVPAVLSHEKARFCRSVSTLANLLATRAAVG